MDFFTVIPEGQGIIQARGIYRQVTLFERKGRVYAKHGGGYVRLNQGGSTSAPNIRWTDLDTPNGSWAEAQGAVTYSEAAK